MKVEKYVTTHISEIHFFAELIQIQDLNYKQIQNFSYSDSYSTIHLHYFFRRRTDTAHITSYIYLDVHCTCFLKIVVRSDQSFKLIFSWTTILRDTIKPLDYCVTSKLVKCFKSTSNCLVKLDFWVFDRWTSKATLSLNNFVTVFCSFTAFSCRVFTYTDAILISWANRCFTTLLQKTCSDSICVSASNSI